VQLLYFCLDLVPNSSRLSPLSVWHPCFIFGRSWLLITSHRLVVLFMFPQAQQKNYELIPRIIPLLLPRTPFVIRFSLSTSSIDAIWLRLHKKAHFVASFITQLRINIWCTERYFVMKSSHSILTKMKLFKRYVPEAVKRAEVSWMLLLETRFWKGCEHSEYGLRDCDTV